MKASDYIVSFLESNGVNVIFGYIGGMITHLVDSISNSKNVMFVQTYHDQSAAFAAEGFAIESGKVGVAISTSGPGATNMITGVADAYFGSIPILFITGQVNSHEYKYEKPIRQQGFQETDIVSIVKPITKYAALVDKAENLKYELEKAIFIALSDRKGPVLLDICMDVQVADVNPETLKGYYPKNNPGAKTTSYDIHYVVELLSKASRPMLLLGAGSQSDTSKKHIREFLKKTQIPVVSSLMGLGVVDFDYEYYLGMIGSYGNRCANKSMETVDLLVAVGTRLDTRQTGPKLELFIENGLIIHVDIDNNELLFHRITNRYSICDSSENFFETLINQIDTLQDYSSWHSYLNMIKSKYNQKNEILQLVQNKSPYRLMEKINSISKNNDVFVVDIGQTQMFAAQTLQIKENQRFVTSGGLAPMGFSLPVSVGMAMANSNKRVISFSGDGGFHIATQSLMLISQYNLPIIAFILNNNSLGMITQFQTLYLNSRFNATTYDGAYLTPDFQKLSEAYSLKYYRINEEDLSDDKLINKIISEKNCVVEYVIPGLTTVSPKLEYMNPIYRPTPDID